MNPKASKQACGKSPAPPGIRLGAIEFINTIPIYTALKQQAAALEESGCELIYRNPATLNTMIDEGLLDISPVSSAHYLRHQDALTLLPDLSVSSPGAVESVLFLSKFRVDDPRFLSQTPVIPVPDDSETSIALLGWLLEEKTGLDFSGRFHTFTASEYEQALMQNGAALVIGDNALLIQQNVRLTSAYHLYDLSCEWQKLTGLPFVFAVWVARSTWAAQHPTELERMTQMLVQARKRFFEDAEIFKAGLADAQSRCSLSEETIRRYFTRSLNYTLETEQQKAIALFKGILQEKDKRQQDKMSDFAGVC